MGGGIALDVQAQAALQEPLMQTIDELRSAYPKREIDVRLALAAPVACDVQRIQQVLSNLLKNALVYGAADAPVQVHAVSSGGQFELSITNGGPPIPQATIDQLFKPFWRASGHTSNEGLGLGLFIVYEIARSHGGQMQVNSTEGKTSFTFSVGQTG
eukprot:gene7639-10190_t